jgi:hypothetical protein
LFACPIPLWFVLSCNLPTTSARAIWLCFGAFLSPPAPCLRLHGALTTGRYSHTPRSTRLHPPVPAGSGRAQTLPRWLLPDTDRRIGKNRTGPDLDERPSIFSMSPNRAIPLDKSNFSSPLAAAQALTILSWPGALNASGSRRACRMAITRNAGHLLVPRERGCPPGTPLAARRWQWQMPQSR